MLVVVMPGRERMPRARALATKRCSEARNSRRSELNILGLVIGRGTVGRLRLLPGLLGVVVTAGLCFGRVVRRLAGLIRRVGRLSCLGAVVADRTGNGGDGGAVAPAAGSVIGERGRYGDQRRHHARRRSHPSRQTVLLVGVQTSTREIDAKVHLT